jgi:amidase
MQAGSVGFTAASLVGCWENVKHDGDDERMSEPAPSRCRDTGRGLPAAADEGICWLPLREQAALVRDRKLSSTELVSMHLDRIGAVNPAVNAVVTFDPERSLREAGRADQAVARGEPLGVLHGVPAGFKDTHDTAGMRTTYGSVLFAEHVPAADDLVVARIRRAGAIAVGKTNVSEFQTGGHTFNELFGVTRNPYDLTRSAGGSGGGSAAALATGMIAAAEGSDLGGSLRNPAAFCNVVGLRPSPGRVRGMTGPFSWQPLTVRGPMGRTVDDVALMLSVISGPDSRSAPRYLTGEVPGKLRSADMRGLRVAWSPDLAGQTAVDPAVVKVLGAQLATFADLGCHVRPACIDFDKADEAFRTLRAWMFAYTMSDHIREHRDQLKPSLVLNIEQGQFLSGRDIASAMASQAELFEQAQRFFEDFDVLALPATALPPFPAELEYPAVVAGEPQASYLDWLAPAYYVTMTGCPSVSVPAGFTAEGLPVGIQLVGPYRTETRLLSIAMAFEEATRFCDQRPDVAGQPAARWAAGHRIAVRSPGAPVGM